MISLSVGYDNVSTARGVDFIARRSQASTLRQTGTLPRVQLDKDLLGLSGKKSRTGSHPELQCLPAALSGQLILLRNQLSLCERSLRQSSHAPVDWNTHRLTTIRRLADDHFLFRLQGIPQQACIPGRLAHRSARWVTTDPGT